MTLFRVTWEIDIEADSPIDAARQALAIQRDPDSIADVFTVLDPSGQSTLVDLSWPKPADLLREAVNAFAEEFNDDEGLSGGDLLQWFAEWRERAKAALTPVEERGTWL